MKILSKYLLAATPALLLGALCCSPSALSAQDNGVSGPPKILVVNREFTKPGRTGTMHEKTESAYVAAARAGKAPFHYLALVSMSGPDRALFLSGFSSFSDWAAENKEMEKMPATGAALDHAMMADGDLLSETDTSVWTRDDDKSLNPSGLKGDRFMEIELYKIKPGHDAQWDEAVKMVKAGYDKAIPEASWTMFEQMFGTSGNEYAVFIPLKSVGELDVHLANDPKFVAAMGADGMKKLNGLMAEAVESQQSNLFHFDPKMSLPPQEWIDAEPDYWKAAPAPMKKHEK